MSRLQAESPAPSLSPKQSPPGAAGPRLDARAYTHPGTLPAGLVVHPADAGEGKVQNQSLEQSQSFSFARASLGIKRTVWRFLFPTFNNPEPNPLPSPAPSLNSQ